MVVVIHTSQKYGNVFELCRFIIRLRCSLACMCFSRFCSKKGTLLLICLSSHSHPQLAHPDCHHYSCIQMSFVKSKRYATGNESSLSVASIWLNQEGTYTVWEGTWQGPSSLATLQGPSSFPYLPAVELCIAKRAEILIVCDGSLHHQHLLINSMHIFWWELGRFWNIWILQDKKEWN